MTDETATLSLAPSLDPPCSLFSSLARFSLSLSPPPSSPAPSMHHSHARRRKKDGAETRQGERREREREREGFVYHTPRPFLPKNARSFRAENFQPLILAIKELKEGGKKKIARLVRRGVLCRGNGHAWNAAAKKRRSWSGRLRTNEFFPPHSTPEDTSSSQAAPK